jgi:hypothetical protein
MAESRDFTSAEAATSAACARYLLHSALDATEQLHRYQQLMGAVARGQISPARVERHITHAAHSSAAADEAERAVAAFVDSFTHCCFVPSEAAMTADDTRDADELDERMDARVIMRHQHALDAFTAQIAALAEPTVSAGARRRALTRVQHASANQLISDAAAQWFTVLSAIGSAQSRTLAPALLDVLRQTQPVGFDGHVVELAGRISEHTSTSIAIENERDSATSVQFSVSDVRRADGVGPAFASAIAITPEQVFLDAHAGSAVTLSVALDAKRFTPGASYVGALRVVHDDGVILEIPLRITTSQERA